MEFQAIAPIKLAPLKYGKIENSEEEMEIIRKESVFYQGQYIQHNTKLWVGLDKVMTIMCNSKLNEMFNIGVARNKYRLRNLIFNRKCSGKYIVEFSNKKVRYKGFSTSNGVIDEKLLASQTGINF